MIATIRISVTVIVSIVIRVRVLKRASLAASTQIVMYASSENGIQLSDDGSYITLSNWKDPTHKDPTRISLTAFPVSADRFRLGYSYRLSWGGSPEYSRARSSVPGLKLQYDTSRAIDTLIGRAAAALREIRAAAKTSSVTDLEQRLVQGHFAGFQELADQVLGQQLEPGQHGLGFAVKAFALRFHYAARFLVHFAATAAAAGAASAATRAG